MASERAWWKSAFACSRAIGSASAGPAINAATAAIVTSFILHSLCEPFGNNTGWEWLRRLRWNLGRFARQPIGNQADPFMHGIIGQAQASIRQPCMAAVGAGHIIGGPGQHGPSLLARDRH